MAKKTEDLEMESGSEIETVDEHATKGTTLPGMGYKVIKPLVEFGKKHEATKEEHRILTDRLIEEGDAGLKLYQKYKEHFTEITKDGSTKAVYEGAGFQVIIKLPGEPKVFTKRVAPREDDSGAE